MADEFNSMQAQLGLVGQGGSFNPLGIATPAPPAPPMVRHPGDISQDIVRQTQTQMATTLQTTSAMRLGGMGGMAFGGGGGGGIGMGAIGAFSQQYQQNMAGIQSQQLSPYSAQMMGMMGGFGGGFNTGMMPNPAMMTTPGMGIYRPFQPPQAPTVSPFPQMPLFQTPFTPMPPPPQFQTPMELSNNMAIQAGQRRTGALFATPGVVARGAADIGFGAMGAGIGASLGARFGPTGALIGGGIGALAGAMGSEHLGLGATAQHITDNLNPFRTMAIRGQQMLGASQTWVGGGPDLNMTTGRGLSIQGATHLGRKLEDTAFSTQFKRDTQGAFSAQDLTRITNVAGQQGMLNDTQSVDQIHDRVKTIAKSLVSFMKIANEPNVVEALKSMGKARQMGLSIGETMDMAMEARMYSKMAGTSVRGIMDTAGMQGAMMYQQQGLSAGLGMRMGMGATGMAQAAVAGGAFTPQRLAMLGGVQGVAQHEMESSAAFLKQPMMAAALSRMGAGGEFGVSGGAVAALQGGRMNIGQMATMGANNMLSAVQRQGVGALGMMQVQGTELQDSIGRALGPQGLQAAKMNQVMQTMNMMGLDKNPGGFATAALSMGMSNDQVKAMMSQASSPGYWRNMQAQNRIQQAEVGGLELQAMEARAPGMGQRFWASPSGSRRTQAGAQELYAGMRNFGEGVSNFFATDEQGRQAKKRGSVILDTDRSLLAGSDAELRQMMNMSDEDRAAADASIAASRGQSGERNARDKRFGGVFASQSETDRALGGDFDEETARAKRRGGWDSALGGVGVAGRRLGRRAAIAGWAVGWSLANIGGEEFADNLMAKTGMGDWDEEDRLQREDEDRGNAAWKESARYEASSRAASKKITELGGGTAAGKDKMSGFLAGLRIDMAKKADKELGWGIQDSKQETRKGAETLARERAKLSGLDWEKMSEEDKQSALAVAMVGVGRISTNEKYGAAYGNIDAGRFKDRMATARQDLTEISNEMFGVDPTDERAGKGIDFFGGTQSTRDEVTDTIFGQGRSGEGGRIAALGAAAMAEEDPNGPAHKAYAEAMTALENLPEGKEKDKIMAEIKTVGQETGKNRGQLEELGKSLISSGKTDAERKALMKSWGRDRLAIKAQNLEASGMAAAFGEETVAGQSIEDLLQKNVEDIDDPGMRKLAEDYQAADSPGKKASIAKRAKEKARRLGTQAASEERGGLITKAGNALKSLASGMADTEGNVSGAFPQAVDSLQSAADTLQAAADALLNKNDTTDYRPDVGGR